VDKKECAALAVYLCLAGALIVILMGATSGIIAVTTAVKANQTKLERLQFENRALRAEKAAQDRANAITTETIETRVNEILTDIIVEKDKAKR